MWKIKKIVSKGDYNYAVVKEHPMATKHGYVLHHRIVMENFLGRMLTRKEIVHHLNENKKDNRVENLQVMSVASHMKIHAKGRAIVSLVCPQCKNIFIRELRSTFYKKPDKMTFCSRRCNGIFNGFKRLSNSTGSE